MFDQIQPISNANGPLEPWIHDDQVNEILIEKHGRILIDKQGKIIDTGVSIHPQEALELTSVLCASVNGRFDRTHPELSGSWEDFRFQIVSEPLADPMLISLRRKKKEQFSFSELVDSGWAGKTEIEQLEKWIQDRENLIVSGPTGSGKTTIIGALLSLIPADQRVVVLQDTAELKRPNAISSALLTHLPKTSDQPKYDLRELIHLSLRLRPDRIVVGEVRGPEIMDWLLAASTGHHGGITSIHSSSCKGALGRLRILMSMAQPQWSISLIDQLLFDYIGGFIHLGYDQEKNRCLMELAKPFSLEKSGIILQPLFKKA